MTSMPLSPPHYLRFVRALALVSGLAATSCSATVVSPDAHPDGMDTQDIASADGMSPDTIDTQDVASTDGMPPDTINPCSQCVCPMDRPDAGSVDAGLPNCFDHSFTQHCCAAIGPLPPPDLPA